MHRSLKRNLVIGLGGACCGRLRRWRVRRHPELRSEYAAGVPERRCQAPACHARAAQLGPQRRLDRPAPGRGQSRPDHPGSGERARAAAEERRHRAAAAARSRFRRPTRVRGPSRRALRSGSRPGSARVPRSRSRPGRRRELPRADQCAAVRAAAERQVAGADRHREGQDRRRPRAGDDRSGEEGARRGGRQEGDHGRPGEADPQPLRVEPQRADQPARASERARSVGSSAAAAADQDQGADPARAIPTGAVPGGKGKGSGNGPSFVPPSATPPKAPDGAPALAPGSAPALLFMPAPTA